MLSQKRKCSRINAAHAQAFLAFASTREPNLHLHKCSYTQRVAGALWETRTELDESLDWCSFSWNFESDQALLRAERGSQKDLHPSWSGISHRCPQTWQTALSRLQSPRASSRAFMVPGFAASGLCVIKGPWNSNGRAERRRRRRRKEDAWFLTSGRRGQMQWGGEEQRVIRVERVSQ